MEQLPDRVTLIAMNNPHSAEPKFALYPAPSGVAGWRLWRMMAAHTGINRSEYCSGVRRYNLLSQPEWDAAAAARAAGPIIRGLLGQRIVVLGAETRDACGFQRATPIAMWQRSHGVVWAWIPHPSGRNRWYNDTTNKAAIELFLEEIWERYRWT